VVQEVERERRQAFVWGEGSSSRRETTISGRSFDDDAVD